MEEKTTSHRKKVFRSIKSHVEKLVLGPWFREQLTTFLCPFIIWLSTFFAMRIFSCACTMYSHTWPNLGFYETE